MSEPKFNIRPYSAASKRQRRIAPPMAVPKDDKEWKRLETMRYFTRRLLEVLDSSAPTANNIADPVISRAMLTIHRTLLRIDRRTFEPTVDRVLRGQKKNTDGASE